MGERLTADSVMTPDGEVVPLGPVDKDGHRVPLNTRRLYDKNGERKTVLWFVYSPCLKHWMVVPDEGQNVATSASSVSHFYLTPPDSWEKLLGDLGDALQQGGRSGHPACAYLAARGLCRGHMDKDGKCRLFDADCCVSGMVSNIRGRIKRLCAGDDE